MKLKVYVLVFFGAVLTGCSKEPKVKSWVFDKTVTYNGVNPIGIAENDSGLWLSDGDHNRVVVVNDQGGVVSEINALDRPMHIDGGEAFLYVPQYGNDEVFAYTQGERSLITPADSLDAPAGISVFQKEMAIADFYNHKIHFTTDGQNWMSFGTEGNNPGEFYYPTDVQVTTNRIWVADAYNNRVQVFDKNGELIKVIGEAEKMNASTGIFATEDAIFVTDFENHRVLVFDHEGLLKQEIKEGVVKPTDVLVRDKQLIIANYGSSSLSFYDWKVAPKKEEQEHSDHDDHEEHDDHHQDT